MKRKYCLLMIFIVIISTCLSFFSSCKIFNGNDHIDSGENSTDDKTEKNELEFQLNEDGQGYTVAGIGNYALKNVVIPKKYKDLPVTTIGLRAFYDEPIVSIIVPEGITAIDRSAFNSCRSLVEISLPNSLVSIGDSAFAGCKLLKEIIIPDSVTELGASIFAECESLESVKLSKNATELKSLVSETAELGFFEYCKSLKNIELPEGITYIPAAAFRGCVRLIELTIPDSVKEIHKEAFASCSSLTSITIPASVESMDTDALIYCNSLYEVCNKSAVRIVNKKQYDTDVICDARSIITDESESRINIFDGFIFYDEGISPILIKYVGENKKVVMPEYEGGKKYSIISNIFSAVNDITELTLTDNITDIAQGFFSHCGKLEIVTFNCPSAEIHSWIMDTNNSITTVYINADIDYTFDYFKALETVVFGEGVTKIVPRAFKGRKITTVTLSSTITEIGAEAFSDCHKLEAVIIPEDSALETIRYRAFYDTLSLRDLTLPSGVKTIDEEAFCDSAITNISLGNILTTIGKRAFWRCPRLTTITIPDSVVEIGKEAFMLAERLKEVIISENSSLTTIGDEAFTQCTALRSINLPKSLQSIGKNAFSRTAITRFIIDKENPYFTVINGDIFSKDESVFVLHAPSSWMTTYVIPNTVTRIEPYAFAYCERVTKITFEEDSTLDSIGEWAFYGMYMTEIIIPASLTTIDANAFGFCQVLSSVSFEEGSKIEAIGESAFDGDHQLEEIRIPGGIKIIGAKAFAWTSIINLYFDGTLEEWEKVEKGENWSIPMGDYLDRYTIHCSDGIIEKK